MWIKLSKNMNDVSCEMQGMSKDELVAFASDKENVTKFIKGAYESAEAVWAAHPEFKTVTLDTLSKEEIIMIEQVKKSKNYA